MRSWPKPRPRRPRAGSTGSATGSGDAGPPPVSSPAPLPAELHDLPGPVLAVAGHVGAKVLTALEQTFGEGPRRLYETVETPAGDDYGSVVLVLRDLSELRRGVSGLPELGRARIVACWLVQTHSPAMLLLPRPGWPSVSECVSSTAGSAVLRVTFDRPVDVREVLGRIVPADATPQRHRSVWPVLGVDRDSPGLWPVADAGTVVLDDISERSVKKAAIPDLVVRSGSEGPVPFRTEADEVLARPMAELVVESPPTWTELEGRQEAGSTASAPDPLSLGALDETLFNPIGFRRDADKGLAVLGPGKGDRHLVLHVGEQTRRMDTERGLTPADIRFVRRCKGVRLRWQGARGPVEYCRVVAALGMAGVPIIGDSAPDWAVRLLGEPFTGLLPAEADLDDGLMREELSIRQRRSALSAFSHGAWRARIARSAGLTPQPPDRVSVLLSTRRPDMVRRAVASMQNQRDADLEILVATHGFQLSREALAELTSSGRFDVRVQAVGDHVAFGDVLNQLAARARFDLLLKVDDDDWYGPHFVADLVLARGYSGGDVVGCPAELTYVEPADLTIRRRAKTEIYHPTVAGGTMLMTRSSFVDVGGFRPHRRFVDAGLLRAVNAGGGSVYRSHGLGYLLHRGSGGHTWDPGVDYFLQDRRITDRWSGLHLTETLRQPDASSV